MIQRHAQPTIKTSRLVLVEPSLKDIDAVYNMRKMPEMITYTDGQIDVSLDDTRAYLEKIIQGIHEQKWCLWLLKDPQSGALLGSISLWQFNEAKTQAEVGYGLMPQYWRQGYMKEAIEAVLVYAKKILNLESVDAYTEIHNVPSVKLLSQLRFEKINQIQEKGVFKQQVFEMGVYSRML